MEYSRFLSVCCVLVISTLTIYVGCLRSYAIYFFERDSKRVVFLEVWSAATVPVALSFMLIFFYLTSKRSLATSEEITAKELFKSSQASLRSTGSRKFSRSSDLESIPESPTEIKKEKEMHLFAQSGNSGEESKNESDDTEEHGCSRKSCTSKQDEDKVVDNDSDQNIIFTLEPRRNNEADDEWFSSRKSSQNSSEAHRGQCVQRKQSEIYKKIGKIDLVPVSLKKISFQVVKPSSIRRFRKDSMFDVFVQLIGIHLPLWMSVVAVYITLVEVLSMKFYTIFYYHHPGLKLLAMFLAVLLGLFHEWKPTYFVNNLLGIAGAYVVIARVQAVSYIAGVVFLSGMIVFDLFWIYGIDVISTVRKQTNAPIMLIIPWSKEGKEEKLPTLDIIVPGVFLNILLKFADMYDSGAFYPSFYAVVFGLTLTFVIGLYKDKSVPAIVLPALFSVMTSLLSVHRAVDLWRFEVKH